MTRSLAPADVAVVGSGLAAAAIALELARRDLVVDLVAAGPAGTPSAPGGPVAAQSVVANASEARADLALLARHLYPDWLSGLEEETGLPCEYDERGAMTIAFDEAEEVVLDRALDALRTRGVHFEVLDPEEARDREPALTASTHAAFAFPRDGVARAGRVGRALVLAARAAGVRVREGVAVRGVAAGASVSGVETSAGPLPADVVVLACRQGTAGIAGAPALRVDASSRPWLELDASADPDRPTRLLVSRGVTLVPRRDGTVLALGSPGPADGPAVPAAGLVAELIAEATRLVPGSSAWGLVGMGGSREHAPGDRLPLLGPAGSPGLFLATGWGPDELLLAPAAAAIAADFVTARTPPLAAGAFAPARLRG